MILFLSIFLAILLGSTAGSYLATEIAERKAKRFILSVLKDEEIKSLAVRWLKDVSKRYAKEYIEGGELESILKKVKKQVTRAFLGGDRDIKLPKLDDF